MSLAVAIDSGRKLPVTLPHAVGRGLNSHRTLQMEATRVRQRCTLADPLVCADTDRVVDLDLERSEQRNFSSLFGKWILDLEA